MKIVTFNLRFDTPDDGPYSFSNRKNRKGCSLATYIPFRFTYCPFRCYPVSGSCTLCN